MLVGKGKQGIILVVSAREQLWFTRCELCLPCFELLPFFLGSHVVNRIYSSLLRMLLLWFTRCGLCSLIFGFGSHVVDCARSFSTLDHFWNNRKFAQGYFTKLSVTIRVGTFGALQSQNTKQTKRWIRQAHFLQFHRLSRAATRN